MPEDKVLEYYFDLYEKGKADRYLNKIGEFVIGSGDVELFPELEDTCVIFIYPWKRYLKVSYKSIKRKSLFE